MTGTSVDGVRSLLYRVTLSRPTTRVSRVSTDNGVSSRACCIVQLRQIHRRHANIGPVASSTGTGRPVRHITSTPHSSSRIMLAHSINDGLKNAVYSVRHASRWFQDAGNVCFYIGKCCTEDLADVLVGYVYKEIGGSVCE